MIQPVDSIGRLYGTPHLSLSWLTMICDSDYMMMQIHPVYPAPTPVSVPKDSASQHSSQFYAPQKRTAAPAALPARMQLYCNVLAYAIPREQSEVYVPQFPAQNRQTLSVSLQHRDQISRLCRGQSYLGRCYGNIVLVPQIKINERSRCRDHGLPQLIPWPWDQSISARREIIGVVSIVGAAFFVAGIVVIMV